MSNLHQSRRHLSAVGVPPVATRARGRVSPVLVVAAGLLLALAAGATVFVTKRSQSLTQLESRLHEADPFVEFVDRPAPAFVLSDGNDRIVRLADMRGRAGQWKSPSSPTIPATGCSTATSWNTWPAA